MTSSKPVRVSARNKCPICGHPSWCMVGDAFILCMRVQSDRPKVLKGGETGWLHPLGDYPKPIPARKETEPADINFSVMLRNWKALTKSDWYLRTGDDLGVGWVALRSLGACFAHRYNAMAFPMRDWSNGIVGIRLRSNDGKKWAVPGSHQGLFIPQIDRHDNMVVCEGPTDTAAALRLGYFAVGRPSCSGGVDHLVALAKRLRIRRVLIVADLDDPGLRGAQTLAELLPVPSAILALPAKDMREFLNAGGNRATMDSLAKQLVWRQPNDNTRSELQK